MRLLILCLFLSLAACGKSGGGSDSQASPAGGGAVPPASPVSNPQNNPPAEAQFSFAGTYTWTAISQVTIRKTGWVYDPIVPAACNGIDVFTWFNLSADGTVANVTPWSNRNITQQQPMTYSPTGITLPNLNETIKIELGALPPGATAFDIYSGAWPISQSDAIVFYSSTCVLIYTLQN